MTLWRGAAAIVVVWLVLSGPVLIGSLRDTLSGDFYQPGGQESFSADVTTFITPSPLWGPGTAPLSGGPNPNHLPTGSVEITAYLGGMPLLLATISLWAARRDPHRVLIWAVAGLVFFLLSLGPYLYIDDSRTFSLFGASFSVPLPYQLYDQLPLAGGRRVPARMVVFGIMALSVLAGIGLSLVMDWLKTRWRLVAPLAAVLVLGTVWLEYWNPPVYLTALSSPAIFSEIRDEPGDFTVLHAPVGRRNGWTFAGDATGAVLVMYYQTLHEKRSIGGYLSRISDEGFTWFLEQPGVRYLSCPTCPQPGNEEDLDAQKVRALFVEQDIRYVVVHRLGPDGYPISFVGDREVQIMDSYVRDVIGMEPVYSDASLTVYRYAEP
jgi:hypothetical protein